MNFFIFYKLVNEGVNVLEKIEVEKWKQKGFTEHEAAKWKFRGFELREALEWRSHGFELVDSCYFKMDNLTPKEAKLMILKEIKSLI